MALVARTQSTGESPAIAVRGLRVAYGERTVLRDVSFEVQRGEVVVIAGGSGAGKSTLLKHLIGLYTPAAGEIVIDGLPWDAERGANRAAIYRRIGVMYQQGALFGSLTVLENVRLPLEEFTALPPAAQDVIALSKLNLVGLAPAAQRLPAELSGGMQKRAAIARALALDAGIVFLDEPSAGLDPITSAELDALILQLRDLLGTTFVIVSHELPSIYAVADRVIVLDGRRQGIVAVGGPAELRDAAEDPWVRAFFNRAAATHEEQARGAKPGAGREESS